MSILCQSLLSWLSPFYCFTYANFLYPVFLLKMHSVASSFSFPPPLLHLLSSTKFHSSSSLFLLTVLTSSPLLTLPHSFSSSCRGLLSLPSFSLLLFLPVITSFSCPTISPSPYFLSLPHFSLGSSHASGSPSLSCSSSLPLQTSCFLLSSLSLSMLFNRSVDDIILI